MGKQIESRKVDRPSLYMLNAREMYTKTGNQKLHMWEKSNQTNGKSIMEANC